ncbi:MAG TPA: hypothetical protein GX701_00435 [Clostridiales bacterium]|nr:hypothetical protein [Clostridiales bacterium]
MQQALFAMLRPEEKAVLRLRRLYEQHGYQKYRMGRFEEYRLYLEHKSFLTSENVITFTDLDGRLMALKPDVTLSIVKDAAAKGQTKRLYYIENVYRPGKDGTGYREISQAGLELVGEVTDHTTAEIVLLARESLATIHDSFLLTINHIGFVDGFLDGLPIGARERASLREALSSKSSHTACEIARKLNLSEKDTELLAEFPKLYGPVEETLAKAKKLVQNEAMEEAISALSVLAETLSALQKSDRVVLDFTALSDPAYYNGLTLTGHIAGVPYVILSGGQYDRLIKRFRKEGGGMGFALYLDELTRLPGFAMPFDVDVAVLYDPSTVSPAKLAQVTQEITESGRSVWAGTALPEDLSYGERIKLEGGAEKC